MNIYLLNGDGDGVGGDADAGDGDGGGGDGDVMVVTTTIPTFVSSPSPFDPLNIQSNNKMNHQLIIFIFM